MRQKRPAARVVLLDRQSRIFLINSSDPGDSTKQAWWEIPGGGIDPGESSAAAARREIVEETGITDFELGPCIWTQECQFTFAGYFFDSQEWIHVAWCDGGEYNPKGLEYFEALAFKGARWWEIDALLESNEPVLPPRLREFIAPIAAGDLPVTPIDIS
ncbi:MAG: NUDIX domain-containing protein [Acidimicrobiia bacterium]|nr:NUDIX domain-containing protein [Acidimicrobiia bacterium]